jgi:hypothetical protein
LVLGSAQAPGVASWPRCFRTGLGSYGPKLKLRFGAILDKANSHSSPSEPGPVGHGELPRAGLLFPRKPDRDTLP